MLPALAGRAAAVVLLGLAVFQVLLVFGAPWGAYTQGGGTEGTLDTSGRVIAAVSCAILLVMAAAVLARVGVGPLDSAPPRVVTVLSWFTTIYSALASCSTWRRRAPRSAPCSRRSRSSSSCWSRPR